MNATTLGAKSKSGRDLLMELMCELHGCTALADAAEAQIERIRDLGGLGENGYRLDRVTLILGALLDKLADLDAEVSKSAIGGLGHA